MFGSSDSQAQWDFSFTPLKSGAQGSKVVVTTHDRSLPSVVLSVSPYPLKVVNDDDCWLLFLEHAFVGETAPSQFEEIG